jgi:hypothetical protein
MEGFGIRFVGINAENGQKLLLTGALILAVWDWADSYGAWFGLPGDTMLILMPDSGSGSG